MDIHRCRFIPYPPQSINALAFSHTSNPKDSTPTDLRLALGRDKGDIEIWNPQNGQWVQEAVLKGSAGRTVEQIAWTQDIVIEEEGDKVNRLSGPLRLFSTGGSNSVTEWDLSRGSPKTHAEGNHGDLWCFAAQPPPGQTEKISEDSPSQLLAAGTGSGNIILFSTDDNDLHYLRSLIAAPKKKSKVISITWRDRKTIVAGYEDSTIRIVDVPNRTIVRTMSLGKPADGNKSVVWTVKCLPDGTVLSGDSAGELKIWDSKNFSLVQRLKTHQADILDIAYNAKGDMIFTFGVDRRTVAYKAIAPQPGSKKRRWTQLMHRRFHDHDIKCAASFESKTMSVLVSGGMDAVPVVLPLRSWQSEYHRSLTHLPQRPQISSSPKTRLIVSWWHRDLLIHYVPRRNQYGEVMGNGHISDAANYELLATLQLKGDEHIQSAQISHDGNLVVASTLAGVRLFQLRKTFINGKPSVRTRPIDLPLALRNFGARLVGLSVNGRWLYAVGADNTVVLAKIVAAEDPKERPIVYDKVTKLRRKSRNRSASSLGEFPSTINFVDFSPDCRVIATGDLSGVVDAWILEGHEDLAAIEADDEDDEDKSDSSSDASSDSGSDDDEDDSVVIHGQKWMKNSAESTFPQLESAILTLSFRPQESFSMSHSMQGNLGLHPTRHNLNPVSHEMPASDIKLIAITATHKIVEFDVLNGRLSDWSRRNPASQLPSDFTKIKDRVMGCFWDCSDPANGERLWMYGSTWLFMLDVSQDLQPMSGEKVGRLGKYDVMGPIENGLVKRPPVIPNSSPTGKKRKRNTGAGDAIDDKHSIAGIEQRTRRYTDNQSAGDQPMIDVDILEKPASEDDEDDENDTALVTMRRHGHVHDADSKEIAMTNGDSHSAHEAEEKDGDSDDGDDEEDEQDEHQAPVESANSKSPRKIPYWHTFQYRSIFGIAVLSEPQPNTTSTDDLAATQLQTTEEDEVVVVVEQDPTNALEVAIIERPMYDVEQLPRFDGGQDWDA